MEDRAGAGRYTGHKSNNLGGGVDDLGLIYMNARYYVPYIYRMVSPDSIVPDPANPQSFNRYAYTLNNPVKFRDPSGHCAETGDDGCWGWYDRTMQMCPECRGLGWEQYGSNFQEEQYWQVKNGWRPAPPPNYPIHDTVSPGHNNPKGGCKLTLYECFYYEHAGEHAVYLKNFEGYAESNPIPYGEFSRLLAGVAWDLYTHDVDSPGFEGERAGYDTPFYNGGGKGTAQNPPWPSDQEVCIQTVGCYGRYEINYFAQGMWSAAAGESLTTAKAIAGGWKFISYFDFASEGVYFWDEYGYTYYQNAAEGWDAE
ncbi:MAG: hypothetical protein GY803_03710 [Chloroflexi bacterium]|nr:hypothetical protein [Chloroflexota bacterium]